MNIRRRNEENAGTISMEDNMSRWQTRARGLATLPFYPEFQIT